MWPFQNRTQRHCTIGTQVGQHALAEDIGVAELGVEGLLVVGHAHAVDMPYIISSFRDPVWQTDAG